MMSAERREKEQTNKKQSQVLLVKVWQVSKKSRKAWLVTKSSPLETYNVKLKLHSLSLSSHAISSLQTRPKQKPTAKERRTRTPPNRGVNHEVESFRTREREREREGEREGPQPRKNCWENVGKSSRRVRQLALKEICGFWRKPAVRRLSFEDETRHKEIEAQASEQLTRNRARERATSNRRASKRASNRTSERAIGRASERVIDARASEEWWTEDESVESEVRFFVAYDAKVSFTTWALLLRKNWTNLFLSK